MTHPRRIAREHIAATLLAAGTAAEDRVWASREPPVDVESILIDQGPVILVYTRRDRVAKDGHAAQGYGPQKRECDVHVEVTAAGALIVDNKLDDLAEQVEEVLDSLEIPGMPSAELRHVETEIETTAEFEQPVGGALITYELCYWREWRQDPDGEDPFFPETVSASPNGSAPEQVASCLDCEDGTCP